MAQEQTKAGLLSAEDGFFDSGDGATWNVGTGRARRDEEGIVHTA